MVNPIINYPITAKMASFNHPQMAEVGRVNPGLFRIGGWGVTLKISWDFMRISWDNDGIMMIYPLVSSNVAGKSHIRRGFDDSPSETSQRLFLSGVFQQAKSDDTRG